MSVGRSAWAEGLDPELFELEADRLRVLANPKRLMIVSLLGEGPRSVSALADRLTLSIQNTSQHLRLMRDRRIVRARRAGRAVTYSLANPVLAECCGRVRAILLEEPEGFSMRRRLRGAPAREARRSWRGDGTSPPAGAGIMGHGGGTSR